MSLSAATLADLAKFDTPTICNAIELFFVRPRNTGFMNDTIKACFPKFPPMVGFAFTTTFRSMASPPKGDAYTGLADQVAGYDKIPGPPVMVFQDLDQPCVSATFGEVMCTIYKSFGAQGIITSGTGRDLDQVEALKFPAFTSGTICAHGYCHMLQMNVPVTVGGIWIEPGALLHGDLNGVTTVPVEIASEIPDACREIMKAEQYVLDYCKSDSPNAKGLAEARKACQAHLDGVIERVRRDK